MPFPVAHIATRLSRHRSTIYREIRRNRFEDSERPRLSGYHGMLAQKRVAERRHRRRKLIRMTALREAVIDRLKAGWSPELIVGRLRFEGHRRSIGSCDGRAQRAAEHHTKALSRLPDTGRDLCRRTPPARSVLNPCRNRH
nr:helix-turn-helix domain-containing protein [Limimaricola cinnabarinus]